MKKVKIVITMSAMFVSCVVLAVTGNADKRQIEFNGLELQGHTNKQSYMLGEPVKVEFKFVNKGETTIKVPSEGVEVGSLKILIADEENGEYKEHLGSGWGRERGRRLDLKPGLTHTYSEVTILWNGKPRVSHLNENAAREVLKGRISTEYVFPQQGGYWIKGLSYIGENFTPIESEPIRIQIKEPVGDDLVVWNQIKGNREIAFLMQKGAFDTGEVRQKEALSTQVEQIFTQFPNSTYSSYLKPNLEKYKADEVRRKEAMEKAMIKPKS